MKLNDLVGEFRIALTNEESKVLENMSQVAPLISYREREQQVIQNLIRKSLVTKVMRDGECLVVRND
jgi:hypothetical protein